MTEPIGPIDPLKVPEPRLSQQLDRDEPQDGVADVLKIVDQRIVDPVDREPGIAVTVPARHHRPVRGALPSDPGRDARPEVRKRMGMERTPFTWLDANLPHPNPLVLERQRRSHFDVRSRRGEFRRERPDVERTLVDDGHPTPEWSGQNRSSIGDRRSMRQHLLTHHPDRLEILMQEVLEEHALDPGVGVRLQPFHDL